MREKVSVTVLAKKMSKIPVTYGIYSNKRRGPDAALIRGIQHN